MTPNHLEISKTMADAFAKLERTDDFACLAKASFVKAANLIEDSLDRAAKNEKNIEELCVKNQSLQQEIQDICNINSALFNENIRLENDLNEIRNSYWAIRSSFLGIQKENEIINHNYRVLEETNQSSHKQLEKNEKVAKLNSELKHVVVLADPSVHSLCEENKSLKEKIENLKKSLT